MMATPCSDVTRDRAAALDCDVLVDLLIEARSLFETDRCRARRCVERAAELVRDIQGCGCPPIRRAPVRGGLSGRQVRQVRDYIDSNLGSRIPIDQLASLAQQSVGHFFRTFRASFGETPQAYILRRRILHAEALMRSSDEPLARIALDCGLCDQSHLSRVFRRIVGVTPNAWRRRAASMQEPAPASSNRFDLAAIDPQHAASQPACGGRHEKRHEVGDFLGRAEARDP
jgi:AraC family transcriptional regulator